MITIYTKDFCPFCSQAKALLENNNIPFEEINIGNDEEAKQFVLGQSAGRFNQTKNRGIKC